MTYCTDLFQLDAKSSEQKKLATFYLDQEDSINVHVDGDENNEVVQNIMREGVFDYKYARPGKVYPEDGMTFLENLRYAFRAGYFLASDVYSKTS